MKSQQKLQSFIKYCVDHPHERFWQALRNWSKYAYIFGYNGDITKKIDEDKLQDTFYIE